MCHCPEILACYIAEFGVIKIICGYAADEPDDETILRRLVPHGDLVTYEKPNSELSLLIHGRPLIKMYPMPIKRIREYLPNDKIAKDIKLGYFFDQSEDDPDVYISALKSIADIVSAPMCRVGRS